MFIELVSPATSTEYYDSSYNILSYIIIGRTGRGGSTGISHTFFTENDKTLAAGLVGVLKEASQEIPQEIYRFPMFTKKKPSNVSSPH